jgi:putative transposase
VARFARVVVPGWPHHVTQRGNRRQQTFFRDGDYLLYLDLLKRFAPRAGVEVWGYCLMPNHVHLILTPATKDALRAAMSEVHQRYTRAINARERWTGFLWQGRFASFPMDESYFLMCARYVALNPVRAGLTQRAEEWPWSSTRAHLRAADDGVVTVAPLLRRVRDVAVFFQTDVAAEGRKALRAASMTGRPLGAAEWIKALEKAEGRALRARGPGRPSLIGDTHSSGDRHAPI